MKILLLGPNGQVGWELQRSLQPLGEVIALGRQQGDLCGDLLQPDALAATVRTLRPDVIVNAAAYTAVDKAESEPQIARAINAEGPAMLARKAASIGALLVHYSTDYVFDGSGNQPRDEEAPTGPLSVYGQTKLEGEDAIRASGCRHLIFRTSWVYAARGNNFAKTMLRLASERDELRVINDQVGSPTGADLLADVAAHALRRAIHDPALGGVYHVAAAGETSWYAYARHVIEWARQRGTVVRVSADAVQAIPTASYPSAAQRPLNSRLDTSRLRRVFSLTLPPWQAGVDRMLEEIMPSGLSA
jgi:dTDP-4-dehydrorhamnose reductase